mgnify:FL=1
MNTLDTKIKTYFVEESVLKNPDRYSIFAGINLPSFIKDWMINRFTDYNGNIDRDALLNFLDNHIPTKDSNIRSRLLQGEEIKILARIIVESDLKNGLHKFAIPDIGIRLNEGRVAPYVIRSNNNISEGENWGVVTLDYVQPEGYEKGYVELVDFKAFKPYKVDFEHFCEVRRRFETTEWIDFLIRCMEYNPDGFENYTQKILFLTRLLVFIEPNLNIIELAPKGTGKSYIFDNLSKYGWHISGGKVTRAKMFYDMNTNVPGILASYEFVAMDEVKTISFENEDELRGALKSYLESGSYTVGKTRQNSQAGLILLGNIDLDEEKKPINKKYFMELPSFFHDTALLDRFHGFIEGWKLPRINEDLKLKGYTLNVEYFSEILSYMRTVIRYSALVSDLLEIPPRSDTRDTTAIKLMATAYLKLIFPHVKSIEDINKNEFKTFCFEPAYEKRGIIKKQLSLMDLEFDPKLPNIKVKI